MSTTLLILAVIVILLPTETYAFGAGDIPDFGYLNDKAFRHGDIENILSNMVKTAGKIGTGGGLLGFASSMIKSASGGSKFTRSDIQKVYFGNWLRDYSQAMDIAGLTKLSADTLVLVVSVLGFMAFGFATDEFQVTPERLGVYLPVEHIDNPKGYSEKEGDARKFHPKLRPPVDPRELEIDERTGMKKYIATEHQSWDTSTALIRRTFHACIDIGRRARGNEGADLWEAYRLLGTGLHTMEDLLAHSNWCELTLRRMGHQQVFCHVGDKVIINTPNGLAPPLVTGTFGGADFLHSLMGEATDHLSQASVTDLTAKMNDASQNGSNNTSVLQDILKRLPIGGGSDKMNQGESIHAESKAYHFNPDNVAPPEVQEKLMAVLKWHDGVFRDVSKTVEKIPGLDGLLEALSNALNAYVYTLLAPWLTPILQQATAVLGEGSKAVIDNEDQFEVFDNPHASDPSHSLLSKDHFGLILNEPAGKIAQLVVENTVKLIVNAWFDDNMDVDQVINEILEAFHHPYFATGRSRIQNEMFQGMERWLGSLDPTEAQETVNALSKESVRNGENKRLGSHEEGSVEPGYGPMVFEGMPPTLKGRTRPSQPGAETSYGQSEEVSTHRYRQESYPGKQQGREEASGYGRHTSRADESSYDSSDLVTGRDEYSSASRTGHGSTYGRAEEPSYSTPRREERTHGVARTSYGHQGDTASQYGQSGEFTTSGYGQERTSGYGNEERSSGYNPSYASEQRSSGYRAQEYTQRGSGYEVEEQSSRYTPGYGASGHKAQDGSGYQTGSGHGVEKQSSRYTQNYADSGHRAQESGYGNQSELEQSSRYAPGYGDSGRRAQEHGYDEDDRTSGYTQEHRSGYGNSGRRVQEQGYDNDNSASGYTQGRRSGYGGGGQGSDSNEGYEGGVQGYGYGRQEHGSSHGDETGEDSSDERRNRGHRGGGSRDEEEETFGAERLNIQEGYGYRQSYEDSGY